MARLTDGQLAAVCEKAAEFRREFSTATEVSHAAVIDSSFAAVSVSLVAEVRRLQALLCVAMADVCCCPPFRHLAQCPFKAVRSEVEAIQAEARAQREEE